MTYIDHVISLKDIAIKTERVQVDLDWNPPEAVKQVRSYLRLASWPHNTKASPKESTTPT